MSQSRATVGTPRRRTAMSISRHRRRKGGAARRLRVGLKAGPETAARLEAGNRGEGLACLFRVCAILPHQACADGSIFPPPAVQGGSVGIRMAYSACFGSFLLAPTWVEGLLSIGHSRLSLALYDALHSLVFLFSYLAGGKPHLQSLERIAFASRRRWRFNRWHWWWYGTRHGWQYTRRHWRWYC